MLTLSVPKFPKNGAALLTNLQSFVYAFHRCVCHINPEPCESGSAKRVNDKDVNCTKNSMHHNIIRGECRGVVQFP